MEVSLLSTSALTRKSSSDFRWNSFISRAAIFLIARDSFSRFLQT